MAAHRMPVCENELSEFKSISYQNILLAFFLLPIGVVAAVVVLVVEKWMAFYGSRT
jgi:hypothetical protein